MENPTAWGSFHPQFIATAMVDFNRQINPAYYFTIESRFYIHEPSAEQRFLGRADIRNRNAFTHDSQV